MGPCGGQVKVVNDDQKNRVTKLIGRACVGYSSVLLQSKAMHWVWVKLIGDFKLVKIHYIMVEDHG